MVVPFIWEVLPSNQARADALARALGVHPLTAQLLLHREVTDQAEATRFLQPSLEALDEPERLPDLERGVDRLKRAIARREPILVFGDSDVDGLTGSVILYEVLQAQGALVRAQQSNRITDGYGVPPSIVQRICRSTTKLVILVDCGTNQPEVVGRLSSHGIATIIVDHHVPLDGWARPHALINPHREARSPYRGLSSAALAFKVAQALLRASSRERLLAYADLAALGSLADCSPLTGESRIIICAGLERIVRSHRRGLQRLCESTGTSEPEPEHILRRLVPRLNASGRLGDAGAVWHLLHSGDQDDADAWMEEVEAAHTQTKQLHRRMLAEAEEQVNRLHFRDELVMVVSRSGWHQGLTGPLASQLSKRYGRPTIAIAMTEHQGVGSGRSGPPFNLLETLKACQELLVRFGGHAHACGLTIDRQCLERFRALVNLHAKSQLNREALRPMRVVELELPLQAVTRDWVEEAGRFAPFGQGNQRPTILIRHLAIDTISPRTVWVSNGSRRVRAKGHFPALMPATPYDVAASPAVVEGSVELMVSDVKPSTGPSGPAQTSNTSYRYGSA